MIWPFAIACAALIMGGLARGAGSELPKPFGGVPEILFGLCFGIGSYALHGSIWWAIAGAAGSWSSMELAHANAMQMGTKPTDTGRFHQLDYVVRPLCRALMWIGARFGRKWNLEPLTVGYCWLFLGLKGTLIGLSIFPFGLPLAVLWPLAYWLAYWRIKRGSAPAEWLTGYFSGPLVALAMLYAWA